MNNKEQINSKVIKLGQQVLDKIASNIDNTWIDYMTGYSNNEESERIIFAFNIDINEKRIYFEISQRKMTQKSLEYSVNETLKYHLEIICTNIICKGQQNCSLNENMNDLVIDVTNLSNSDNFAAIEALFERAKKLYPLIKESESKRDFSKEKTLEFNKKILDFEFGLNN